MVRFCHQAVDMNARWGTKPAFLKTWLFLRNQRYIELPFVMDLKRSVVIGFHTTQGEILASSGVGKLLQVLTDSFLFWS